MLTPEQHLDDLVRHIELVRTTCLLLGKRLMAQGRIDFGRQVVARGFAHDASKFSGIEWDYLHAGADASPERIEMAIRQHQHTNPHHPEYWGGFEHMPEISVAEMVCDWYARSAEFGTGLREWIRSTAVERYHIDPESEGFHWVMGFVDLLLEKSFSS